MGCVGGHTELVSTDDQDRLVDLESQQLGLDEVEGLAVDLDESFTGLYISNQYNVLLRIRLNISWRRAYLAVSDS